MTASRCFYGAQDFLARNIKEDLLEIVGLSPSQSLPDVIEHMNRNGSTTQQIPYRFRAQLHRGKGICVLAGVQDRQKSPGYLTVILSRRSVESECAWPEHIAIKDLSLGKKIR